MHVMQVAGAEVLVRQIIEQLGDKISPTILCLDAVGTIGEQLMQSGVPLTVLDRKPGMDWGVAKRMADVVKTQQIQVLHAHQYTPFFYAALGRLRHRMPAKILFTEHGRHYPDIVSWKRRWANKVLLQRYADKVTACCDFSTEALHKIEGFPKAFTLANGVDMAELPACGDEQQTRELRSRLGLDLDRPYAACIARFHAVKDHATLIRGWQRVHQQLPEARLLLVGGGEEESQLREQVTGIEKSQAGFQDSVQFLGIRHDVPDILRAIDVFTLTSVSEAASLTLLEAMASQCASVVTAVGGNGEHLRQGTDGYLVPRADDQALASKLVELLTNKQKAQKMGHSAREQVQTHFNLNTAVDHYYQLYESLVASTPH